MDEPKQTTLDFKALIRGELATEDRAAFRIPPRPQPVPPDARPRLHTEELQALESLRGVMKHWAAGGNLQIDTWGRVMENVDILLGYFDRTEKR